MVQISTDGAIVNDRGMRADDVENEFGWKKASIVLAERRTVTFRKRVVSLLSYSIQRSSPRPPLRTHSVSPVARSAQNPSLIANCVASLQKVNIQSGSKVPCSR